MPSPYGSPCCPDIPSYCIPTPIVTCTNPEPCEEVYSDKCIIHDGNYLPNLDVSAGTRLDAILTKIDSSLTTITIAYDLTFPATASGSTSTLVVSVLGASDGDVTNLGFQNVCYVPNTFYTSRVSGANMVSVDFINLSGSSVTPTHGIFKIKVFK